MRRHPTTCLDAFSPALAINSLILRKSLTLARMLQHCGYKQLNAQFFIFLEIMMLKNRIAVLTAGPCSARKSV
jgi:hypothetical protein